MTQRVLTLSNIFTDRPFQGEGYSVYATIADVVRYRNQRILPSGRRRWHRPGWIKGSAVVGFDYAGPIAKTARRASGASSPIDWALPASFASQTGTFDIRHFKDDVENESDNFRTVTVTLDASRDDATGILGTAVLLDSEVRDSGIVRLRFLYIPAREGIQPTTFRITRTAGPTSPSDQVQTYDGERLIEIDTPPLSDASPYTYTIRAENGAVTKDVLTGISVQADASGPPVPTLGSAAAW